MIGFNIGKPIVLSCCLALASFASAPTAKADLHAEASYGYNWWGSTDVTSANNRIFDQRLDSTLLALDLDPIHTEPAIDCNGATNDTVSG